MQAVVEFLLAIINFIWNQVETVLWVVNAIPQLASFFVGFFGYCPGFLFVFLEVSLALTILFAIIRLL